MQKHLPLKRTNFFLLVLFSALCSVLSNNLKAQLRYNVLFLGNSYTGVNNLPQIIKDIALSTGDTLILDSNSPGGYQLIDHSLDVNSRNKIIAGGWNYVVIQGQSQEPITFSNQFTSGGSALNNLVKQYNPCAITMPYMTWGRKNGDASNCGSFPVMCTYQGMDTTIRNRYLNFTKLINGEVSPVSVVWNYLRNNHPTIELYQADESHPSPSGSYVAACCFYASIFKKDPTLISYNFGLNANDAAIIKNAVKILVYDSLQRWDFKKPPTSKFSYQVGNGLNEIVFSPISLGVKQTYFWDFGDSTTAIISNPTHSFATNGTYTVSLTTTNCDIKGLQTSFTDTIIQFCNQTPTVYTNNPWLCIKDTLWTQHADAYQWLINGISIPETNQSLPNYSRYGISGFAVFSTQNGCTELSKPFKNTPIWSGYYFDALGNPCIGDTVKFTVLHMNGFLSGVENILWYKNDTLLPLMTNKDTLFITSKGKYECKVINPNANCALDTTSYFIEYNCVSVGLEEKVQDLYWSVYPNPASEFVTIKFSNFRKEESIQIYNAIGVFIKTIITYETAPKINIVDLPTGLYFIRLKNNNLPALKFIKQ